MKRKLLAALLALAAFVVSGVSATSASATILTFPTGTALATGSTLKGTNVGPTYMTTTTTERLIECTKDVMTGTLNTNSGGSVAGTITSAMFEGTGISGDCTTSTGSSVKFTTAITGGLPYCLKNTKEDNFEIRGGTCADAARSIKFTMDFTNGGTCGYEKSNLTGTFTTHETGDAIFTSVEQGIWKRFEITVGSLESFLCPAEAWLDLTFTMERDTPTAEPVYLSS
jgi:hypothetical protein